jgi:hypothetical protein
MVGFLCHFPLVISLGVVADECAGTFIAAPTQSMEHIHVDFSEGASHDVFPMRAPAVEIDPIATLQELWMCHHQDLCQVNPSYTALPAMRMDVYDEETTGIISPYISWRQDQHVHVAENIGGANSSYWAGTDEYVDTMLPARRPVERQVGFNATTWGRKYVSMRSTSKPRRLVPAQHANFQGNNFSVISVINEKVTEEAACEDSCAAVYPSDFNLPSAAPEEDLCGFDACAADYSNTEDGAYLHALINPTFPNGKGLTMKVMEVVLGITIFVVVLTTNLGGITDKIFSAKHATN